MNPRGSQASATLRFPREVPPSCIVWYCIEGSCQVDSRLHAVKLQETWLPSLSYVQEILIKVSDPHHRHHPEVFQ
jgi:hypothetical protein